MEVRLAGVALQCPALYQACCSKHCSTSRERLPLTESSVQGMSTI